MSSTKQKSSAAKGVAVFFIVFILLELLIIVGISRVFKNKDVTPSLAGYSIYIMDSNAMGDAVPQDALVIAANGAPSRDGIKKAVIAENVPGVGTSVFWLADVSTSSDLNGVVYTVFQEKYPDKTYQLKTSDIIGTASSYYLTAGKVIRFVTSEFGRIACIAAPLFLFVLLELIIMLFGRVRSGDYDDDDDYDDDEDDEKNETKEQPVKLDDFLFGGENDQEKLSEQARAAQKELKEEDYAPKQKPRREKKAELKLEPKPEIAPKQEPKTQEPEEKPAESEKTEAPAEKEAGTIDPSYYEKAARLIDGEPEAPAAEAAEPAPKSGEMTMKAQPAKKKPTRKKPSQLKFSGEKKNASASMADLMKLMEQEQNKLKDQIGDKNSK